MALIDIMDGWAIGTYDRGYIVGKKAVTFDAKSGNDREYIDHPAYFSSISECVSYAYKGMVRETIGRHRKNISLEQVILDMRNVENRIEARYAAPIHDIEEFLAEEVAKR